MSDRLNDTLTALRADADRTPLADASAVRRRGQQRTRRQAVGSSLAVLAVVAAGVGVGGSLLSSDDKAQNMPAKDQTITTTESPSPAPTVQEPTPLDTDMLLGADDMPPVPNQTFSVGETLEDAGEADAEERGMQVCRVNPSGAVQPDLVLVRTFPSDLDAFAWEWVARYRSPAQATQAFGALTNSCAAAPGSTESLFGLPDGAVGIRTSSFSSDPGSEFNGELGGVVRQGDVVVVVGLRAMAREGELDLEAFDRTVVEAAERIASR